MKRNRVPGKPAILDDQPESFRVMWLVSIPTMSPREPIHVRAVKTQHGWRGWHVGGDPTRLATHWYGHYWSEANESQTAKLDEQYGTDTPKLNREIANDPDNPVCDVTHSANDVKHVAS